MEVKLNIANILKNKQKGTKLYTDAFGELSLEYVKVNEVDAIYTKNKTSILYCFYNDGKYNKNGKPILVPSKEMRDWNKFAWKKGDVLVCYEGKKPYYTIFDCFESNTYKDFKGKFSYDSYEDKWYQNEGNLSTNTFHKLSIADSEIYITKIEERFGGKLNFETLEIEKNPASFKDGDIVVTDAVPDMCYSKCIFILKGGLNACEYHANSYVFYNTDNNRISFDIVDRTIKDRNIHLATEEEKQQLFEALAKEGKAWDAEKKMIVDLKPKWTPKPFDKIVGFEELSEQWVCDMFSHYSKNYEGKEIITALGGCTYIKALPYNEDTAKLIGTSDDWEG